MEERLFTPGPVEIPNRVREVLGRPIIHHRTEEFKQSFLETRALLKKVLNSPSDNIVFFSSSGTGAMEAAILNFFEEGDKVLVINGGKFGERWLKLAEHWKLKPLEYKLEWGKSADPLYVKDLLDKNPDCKGVLYQISETSTGAYHPYREISQICFERGILSVADAITALGAYKINPDQEHVDVLIGGSQKALLLPPGLSVMWFSDKAKERLTNRAFYFSIKKELPKQIEGQTAWTPAISLILALNESLSMLLEEGMDNVHFRHESVSKATQRAIQSLGFKVFPENPSISLTVFELPNAEKVRRDLISLGIRTAGGQDNLKGRVIRISHMGVSPMDGMLVIGMLEVALRRNGFDIKLGEGVSAYSQTLMERGVW